MPFPNVLDRAYTCIILILTGVVYIFKAIALTEYYLKSVMLLLIFISILIWSPYLAFGLNGTSRSNFTWSLHCDIQSFMILVGFPISYKLRTFHVPIIQQYLTAGILKILVWLDTEGLLLSILMWLSWGSYFKGFSLPSEGFVFFFLSFRKPSFISAFLI